MQVVYKHLSGQPLLQVSGDVDHMSSAELLRAVDEALSGEASHLLFDLSACTYLDSGGDSVLLQALGRVRPAGRLGVIAAQPQVLRILSIVGITVDPCFRGHSTTLAAGLALEQDFLQ